MNAFFASIEQQENLSLRGKPVVVTPTPCPSGCIITSSYEARKKGIKTGMSIREAQNIFPNIHICASNTFLYLKYHKRIIEIVKNITPFYKIKSIDELTILIPPSLRTKKSSTKFANNLKNKINTVLGNYIRCSIGIAQNIFLAKTAAEFIKPDGLTIIEIKDIKKYLSRLKLTDLCGISCGMKKRLFCQNINSPIDFYSEKQETLKSMFGKIGEYWFLNLHGFDIDTHNYKEKPKSISQSHVLEPKFRSKKLSWPICQKLIYKAAFRLRNINSKTDKLYLKINFCNKEKYKRIIKIPQTSSSIEITKHAKNLFQKAMLKKSFPFKITIAFPTIIDSSYTQKTLFGENKQNNIFKTIDEINSNYKSKIMTANEYLAKNTAPDRISFGKPF